MNQERQTKQPRKDFFEDFRILRDSDYWFCLPRKIQEEILRLLAEQPGEYGNNH